MLKRLPFLLAMLVVGDAAAAVGDDRVEIVPATPTALAPVHARVWTQLCYRLTDIRFAGGSIRLQFSYQPMCDIVGDVVPTSMTLGRLPPGDWTVAVVDDDGDALFDIAPVTFTVPPSPRFGSATDPVANGPLVDISGLWGIAGRSGAGVTFTTSPDGLLAALVFIYEDGGPRWYSIQFTPADDDATWNGDVLKTSAPGDLYGPMPSATPQYTWFDAATLTLDDPAAATLCLAHHVQPPSTPPAPRVCHELFRYPFD